MGSPFPLTQTAQQDTDSDPDIYHHRPEPSQESLPAHPSRFDSSTPTFQEYSAPVKDAYPAWSVEREAPLSKEEIEDVFLDLTQKFGFQRDSMRNMVYRCLLKMKIDADYPFSTVRFSDAIA